jgi:predicted metal-dependent hydrolase
VAGLQAGNTTREGALQALDEHYLGYFTCFNAGEYYEAHDVLEHLWLRHRGPEHGFYKGLIQIAGAFVHLRKQYLRPDHPKDGRRLNPAVRLFRLGQHNLEPFRPRYLCLDVNALSELADRLCTTIVTSDYEVNPWHPETAPQLNLDAVS